MREVIQPRQVILVTCRGKADMLGKSVYSDNIITLAWHTPLSFNPELYGICVGKNRFSYKIIKDSKVFAVNFIYYEMKKQAIECGTSSGANLDKFEKFGMTKEDCETIDCCRLGEASAVLECEVVDSIDTGDHVFFVGKVNRTSSKDSGKRLFHLGGNGFTSTL